MKAMILAAGRGERLRPLTDRIPKVLAEVDGEPLLAHQLRWLAAAGIGEVVINLHHLGQQIVDAFGDGSRHGVKISYSLEPELLETGGGIVKALPLLGTEPFVLVNGDIYTDFPFSDLRTELAGEALARLVLTPRPEFRARGDFECANGWITAQGNSYVYCGIGVWDPAAFAGRVAQHFSLRDVLFALVEQRRVAAQVWEGYWSDIGTPEQLRDVNRRYSGGSR